MTNSLTLSRIQRMAAIAVALSITLAAAPRVPKTWTQLATYLKGKYVTITMKNGTTERGSFAYSRNDALVFQGGKEVPRDMVVGLRLESDPLKKGNLAQLRGILQRGYKDSFRNLGSPVGPFALVGVPVITAYAVVATPFCALGDLFGRRKPAPEEIEILPDSK